MNIFLAKKDYRGYWISADTKLHLPHLVLIGHMSIEYGLGSPGNKAHQKILPSQILVDFS
jgi:hypothetical protein